MEEQEDAYFIVCKVRKRVWTGAGFYKTCTQKRLFITYVQTTYHIFSKDFSLQDDGRNLDV
ncbi:hypothetical protein COM86_21770 [Priestia megaterium]|nr:hypothetical protein COM86_21770 [Priestia megaterium]